MEYQVSFTPGLPPTFGSYLLWMWDGMVIEGRYWRQDDASVVTHYNMVEPLHPQTITQSANKICAWAPCQQARPEASDPGVVSTAIGPLALVTGATGSGKSTIILSYEDPIELALRDQ